MNAASDERAPVCFRILGPLGVSIGGEDLLISARRQRGLIVLLLLNPGRVVPAERLIDQLWDGAAPPQAAVTLRSYVSNLRRALGGKGAAGLLRTHGAGYAIDAPPESIDAVRLERLAGRARDRLRAGEPEQAIPDFDAAIALWDGSPLADIADHAVAQGIIAQLTETYLGAVEGRLAALVASGRHLDAIPGLESFAAEHPFREEPHALLMTALYAAGRTPDALDVHHRFGDLLREELGIDPSPGLDRLRQDILNQAAPVPSPLARTDGPRAAGAAEMGAGSPRRRIVGRERELAQLGARLDELGERSTGSLTLITGEPGIGKSTLLEWLHARGRSRGVAVHSARVPATGGAPPFWPWSQIVESIAATLSDDELRAATSDVARPVTQLSATISARTGGYAPPTGDDAQGLRFAVYEAVSELLRRVALTRPIVITIDDAHATDAATLELISYLVPTLSSQPILLAVTYRNLPHDRSDALVSTLATLYRDEDVYEIGLTGLTRDAVAELAAGLVGDELGEEERDRAVDALASRSGGNPLFLRQLAALPCDPGSLGGHDDAPVPASIRSVISVRLSGLSRTARDLVDAAAVVGRDFSLRAAAAVGGVDAAAALEAFDEARAHGIFEDSPERDGARRFVHALVQEVVLGQLPSLRASRLHERAAEQLASDSAETPESLAEHAWAGRELMGARAVQPLLAAADAASRLYSYEDAEKHVRRALTIVQTDGAVDRLLELTVLLRLLSLISVGRGWGDPAVRGVLDRAMAITERETLRDDTVRLWWSLFFYLLDRDEADRYRAAARTLIAALTAVEAEAHGGGDHDRATVIRPDEPGHAARAAVHLMAIFGSLAVDDRVQAEQHLRSARAHVEAAAAASLAAYEEHLHVMLLLIEAYWHALHDDAARYEAAAAAAVALADADGRPFVRAVARTLAISCLAFLSGSPTADHRRRIDEALAISQRFGFGWLESLATVIQAWSDALGGGDARAAEDVVRVFLAAIADAGRFGNQGIVLLLLADVRRSAGRPDEAVDALRKALARPGPYAGLTIDALHRRARAFG